MNRRTLLVMATLWIVSLVGVAVWAQSGGNWSAAQTITAGQNIGDVITGDSVGFQRVAAAPGASRDGKVVGKWMVKVNGVWMETQSPVGIVR